MYRYVRGDERDEVLVHVAEMYYERGLTQAEISGFIGVTRSAVSRMLTEAKRKGIVETRVHRPMRFDGGLAGQLVSRFGLHAAYVLVWNRSGQYDKLRERIGQAAALVLRDLLRPGLLVGVGWGTTIAATIEALEVDPPVPLRVTQLVGVLGSSTYAFNAQALAESLARKLKGEGSYLYTPFLVEDRSTARSLLRHRSVREAMRLGRRCDIALLGVGTTEPEHCSLYMSGHITHQELEELRTAGAVGDVNGYHYDDKGNILAIEFNSRLVAIAPRDLLHIPVRMGIAAGKAKARSILGALRGRHVNLLVTDSVAATYVLDLDREDRGRPTADRASSEDVKG